MWGIRGMYWVCKLKRGELNKGELRWVNFLPDYFKHIFNKAIRVLDNLLFSY